MAVLTTPRPDRLHKPSQTLPYGLSLYDPVPPARFGPKVGKSEEVECTLASHRFLSKWWRLELNQRRLLRMDGKLETVEPLREDFHHPAGGFFQLEPDDEIIGKTHQKAS